MNWRMLRGWVACLVGATAAVGDAGDAQGPSETATGRSETARIFERFDRDNRGVIDLSRVPERARERLRRMDLDGDGKLTRQEVEKAAGRPGVQARGRSGEINTPAAKGERLPEQLEVGDPAPDFTLPLVGETGTVTLSSFRDQRPVVLIFASYT